MTPGNVLQRMLRAPHMVPDPGDAGIIDMVKDRQYVSIAAAGTETRILSAPDQPGLVCHLGSLDAQTVTVTVKNTAAETTGTITFTAAGQWIGLVSAELTDGVYSWQATDVYGCTTTIQTANNWSAQVAAGTMTTLVVSQVSAQSIVNTAITSPTIVGTSLTALTGVFKSINCSTGMTAAALTATAMVAGTGGVNCSAGKIIQGQQLAMTGGTAATSAQAITAQQAFLAFTASTNNFYALPTSANGLAIDVVNRVGSTAVLVAANATQSIQGATSFSVASSNAVGGAPTLICDGTNWFRGAQ
jgi:hypothetical protein